MMEARSLSYRYPTGLQALENVSFQVGAGQMAFFHGPNGAGKSTLLQCLCGLFSPQDGQILLDGKPVADSAARLEKIGIVFQNPDDQLIAGSVLDEVAFGPLQMGLSTAQARRQTEWAMDAMGISDLAGRPPHLLSHGQKKRVCIAAVLSMGQDILLLDEPTAGLDAAQSGQLVTLLQKLRDEGKTLLVSTHDADFTLQCADLVGVLAQGKLLEAGTAEQIFSNREVMEAAGLRPPAALSVWKALHSRGILADSPLPRSTAELLLQLKQLP